MTLLWEALPLATLAGTTLFCAWRWARAEFRCRKALAKWADAQDRAHKYWWQALEYLQRLDKIERQRHNSAKRDRAAQLQQHRSKVAQTKAEIDRELGW